MRLGRLDLNLLPVLHAILTEGSVTKASIRLNLTQAATSNALARLRETLGDPLFVQAGRELVPTAYTREIATEVAYFNQHALRFSITQSHFIPAESDQSFVVQMSDYAATLIMEDVSRRIHAEAPGVTLHIQDITNNALDRLETGDTDLVILPRWRAEREVANRRLWRDGLSCLVCAGNQHVGESLDEDIFLGSEHVVTHLDFWDQSEGNGEMLAQPVNHTAPTCMLVPQLVMGTERIAVLPTLFAERLAREYPLRLLPLPVPCEPLEERLCWSPSRTCHQAHSWLREILCAAAVAVQEAARA